MGNLKNIEVGSEVVRSIGDYVVGRIGTVVAIDSEKGRAQVAGDQWGVTTWVSFKALELTSIPYEIVKFTDKDRNRKTGRIPYPKYRRV